MYKSPIEIIYDKVHNDILDKTEEYIMLKIEQAMEVKVDKDEMIKALKYDRNQYEKGYNDAVANLQKTGKWIDDKCSICGKGIKDLIDSPEWYENEEPNFCPFCGVKMEIESEDKE